jgi:hypothetical protein
MKTLATPPSPTRLRNEVHVEMHVETYEIIKKYGAGSLGITELLSSYYLPALDAETSILDEMKKSEYTADIKAQDVVRDSTVHGFTGAVRALTHHPDEATRRKALKIQAILEHYGNLAQRGYSAQTAAIDDVLRELRTTEHLALVTALNLEMWLELLDAENTKFSKLVLARYGEAVNRPNFDMKTARANMDNALRAVLDRIEAMITLTGITYTPALKPFAAEWNDLATRYKHTLAQEQGRRDAKKDEEEL